MGIAENIEKIKVELPSTVRLVAVSKFHPLENILEAYRAGQRAFAESRPQEFHTKILELQELGKGAKKLSTGAPAYSDIQWHFIGHLQSNKIKLVLPYVAMVQSVDSVKLLDEINAWGEREGRVTNVLLEAHIASEETKTGLSINEIEEILLGSGKFPHICFRGLMGMATFTKDENVIRGDFSRLKNLFDRIVSVRDSSATSASAPSSEKLKNFSELSIGMSDDFRIALDYGATIVRIGTGIFGPRVY